MATEHKIVLIDGGDDVGASFPIGGVPSAPSSPKVNPRVEGPSRSGGKKDGGVEAPEVKGPTAADSAGSLVSTINKILVGSALIDNAQQLAAAFSSIRSNVTNIGERAGAPTAFVKSAVTSPASAGRGGVSTPAPAPSPGIKGPAAGGATAAEGMATLGKVAGAAGIAVGGLVVAAAAGAMAVKAFDDALRSEAKRLEGFSGSLSAAGAMNDVRSELADIRRANRIGPDLARFENARGKLDDAMKKVMDEIYAILARLGAELTPAILATANGVELMAASIAEIKKTMDLGIAKNIGTQEEIWKLQHEVLTLQGKRQMAMIRLMEGEKDQEDPLVDPDTERFLNQFLLGGKL